MKSYIPTIDISSLLQSDFNTLKAKNTIRKIEKACVDIGFFQVTGHGIDIKKINNICKIGNKFFNSSNVNKSKLTPKKWKDIVMLLEAYPHLCELDTIGSRRLRK